MPKLLNAILLSVLLNALFIYQANAQHYTISSPDKNITVQVDAGTSISYTIKYKDKVLIQPSPISMNFQPDIFSGKTPAVSDTLTRSVSSKINPAVKEKRTEIPDIYKELILRFGNNYQLNFRAYNDGVAYRWATNFPGELTVIEEEVTCNFQPGTIVYYPQVVKRTDADIFHTAFEEPYTRADLDTVSKEMFAFTPVLLELSGMPKVLITESDVTDYPGMFLGKTTHPGLKGLFAQVPSKVTISEGEFKQKLVTAREPYIARTKGSRTFPWRVIAIATTDASLLVNDIVYRLAPGPEFSDYSWIKPGKSTEEWITGLNLYGVDFVAGLNTQTYKYYIDFAERFGFQYVMLDAGWSDVNDLFKITPGMDMEEITSYAKSKGIGLILWTQALTIESQMVKAFEQFKKWDIKIVMTDFIDRNDQASMNFIEKFASECARYRFMCMIHGAPVPAGFSRTYPNMLTREAALGSEYNIWSSKANPEHDLLIPFIRMVSGPMDYEPGLLQNATKGNVAKMGFEKVIAQGTTMHQIAMFVVYESPLQLFAGNISDALREPELMELVGRIPTVWDETIILEAQLGKYIVEVRRSGKDWYLAAINNWTPTDFSISLSFLKEGVHSIESASDGINAHRNPHDYTITKSTVTSAGMVIIKLAPGGGFIARISLN